MAAERKYITVFFLHTHSKHFGVNGDIVPTLQLMASINISPASKLYLNYNFKYANGIPKLTVISRDVWSYFIPSHIYRIHFE